MASSVLEWTLVANDKASDKFRAVGKSADDAGNKFKGFGKIAGAAAGAAVSAFAAVNITQQIGSFFTGAVQGAADLGETLSKSEAIFGENAAAIEEWGSTAATKMGLAKSEAIAAASSFGDMFLQLGYTGVEATETSKAVVQAAVDLGSFSNLDTVDVLDRISGAFRGEYDALQKVIPNISAARVETEAMSMSGKANAKALTAQEKAAAVLAIVQKDGARAMGDFAKTADSAVNQQRSLNAEFKDQQGKLGAQLLPLWTNFISFLRTNVVPVLSTVTEWISKNGKTLAILGGVIGSVTAGFVAFKIAIGLWRAAAVVATAVQWALNIAMSANPFGLIVIAIGALVAAIVLIATQTTFFQDVWENVMNALGTALNWVWKSVIKPVIDAIAGAFDWIGSTIRSVFEGVSEFIKSAFESVLNVVRGPINGIIGLINNVIDGLNTVHVTIPDWVPLVGGQTFGINLPKIPTLATGGTIMSSGLAMVGELGPELVTLPRGASVIPNKPSMETLSTSGSPINVTVNVTAGAVANKDELSKAITSSLVDGIKRGVVAPGELRAGLGLT